MEYNEFKKRYQAQIMLGRVIDLISEFQLKADVSYINLIAKSVCPLPELEEAHWLVAPFTPEQAWALYGNKTDAS